MNLNFCVRWLHRIALGGDNFGFRKPDCGKDRKTPPFSAESMFPLILVTQACSLTGPAGLQPAGKAPGRMPGQTDQAESLSYGRSNSSGFQLFVVANPQAGSHQSFPLILVTQACSLTGPAGLQPAGKAPGRMPGQTDQAESLSYGLSNSSGRRQTAVRTSQSR
jgi:hypothetical protein